MIARTVLLAVALMAPATRSAIAEEVDLTREIRGSDCLDWITETYRLQSRLSELELGFEDEYADLVACVERDLARMQAVMPLGWCDNVFKVHCSALLYLTEIGEAEVDRCAAWLGEELGIDPAGHRQWTTCGENAIFTRYSDGGELGAPATCRSVLLDECGEELDPSDEALSVEERSFIACCAAESIEPADRDAGKCAMLDDAFSRGPCLDRPVCVNRRSGQWLRCGR